MQNYRKDIDLNLELDKIKATYNKAFPFIFVFLFVIFISFYYFIFSEKKPDGTLLFIAIISMLISLLALFAIFFIRQNALAKMKVFFAENIIKAQLANVFTDFEYDHESRLSDHILKKQMYFNNRIDKVQGSDFIKGTYKGLKLLMSDVSFIEITVTTDSKGRRRESQNRFFKGIWCVCDLERTLQSDLWIIEKTSIFNLDYSSVKTDSESFNKAFAIHTETPVEAFYVLTPHMMEYIEAMDKKAKGTTRLRFLPNGELYIALDSKRDSFEFNFNCDIQAARELIRKDLAYITDFIDELISSPYYRKSK